ncbi:type II secretion system protein [Massilia niabensis]|uniref:Type II secretion system protein n=1 Tax=Massilia niabensis TaxID=544910 RepID=A0ABW0LBZ8_9BURK
MNGNLKGRAPRAEAGFTYIGLIVFVTIIGMVGAATLKVGALLQRAEAENELLAIGAEFSAALASYAQATPPGQPAQPLSLEALLRDPRFPSPRRHLRRIFVDPITGSAEWGLVQAAPGTPILGVYSLSQAKPLKVANFDTRFVNFEHKQHLSDWKFTANGQGPSANGAVQGQGAPVDATMFPPPPEPAAPVAAPVAEQGVLRELVPPPPPEPADPQEEEEKEEEEAPPETAEPPPAPVRRGG